MPSKAACMVRRRIIKLSIVPRSRRRSCALFARIRALTNKIRRVGSPADSDSAGLEFHFAVACPRAFLLCLRHPNTVRRTSFPSLSSPDSGFGLG